MCDKAQQSTAKRTELLTRVVPPTKRTANPEAITSAHKVFGPFPVGTLVRVKVATGAAWFLFGPEDVEAIPRVAGVPLVAWGHEDYEVTHPSEEYVSVVMDTDSTEAYAIAYGTGSSQ